MIRGEMAMIIFSKSVNNKIQPRLGVQIGAVA